MLRLQRLLYLLSISSPIARYFQNLQSAELDLSVLSMNGANGVAGPPGLWSEARNADGRVYYYNTVTKATQWTKPTDLMTPAEVSWMLLISFVLGADFD